MRRFAFSILVAIAIATPAMASPITYNLISYPTLQNGYTLSGFIRTNGVIGSLSNADITGWGYSITDGSRSVTYLSTDASASGGVFGSLTATPTTLFLTYGNASPETQLEFFGSGGVYDVSIEWHVIPGGLVYRAADRFLNPQPFFDLWGCGGCVALSSPQPTAFTIATVVPEPASFWLVLAGVGGLAGRRLRRRGCRNVREAGPRL